MSEESTSPAPGASTFVVRVVTPERTVYDGPVERLDITGTSGRLELLPGHAAFMTGLAVDIAVLTPPNEAEPVTVAVHGGFLDVTGRGVALILADAAELSAEIDATRVEEARRRAEERLAQVKARGGGNPAADLDIDRARLALMRALTRRDAAQEAPASRRHG